MIDYILTLDDLQFTILAIGGIILLSAIIALVSDKIEEKL